MIREAKRYTARSVGVAIGLILLQMLLVEHSSASVFVGETYLRYSTDLVAMVIFDIILGDFKNPSTVTYATYYIQTQFLIGWTITCYYVIGHYSDK